MAATVRRSSSRNFLCMCKIRLALVPKRTVQPSLFVTIITCGGHHDNVSPQRKGRNIWQKKMRTVPVAIIRRNGKRYVGSPYGIVDWVRNLRAAEEATLTRGRRSETVNATELPTGEAALVLREDVKDGNPFARYFGVSADSSLEEFEQAVVSHPLFVLQPPLVQRRPRAEREEPSFSRAHFQQ